jgi:hypothetical protein
MTALVAVKNARGADTVRLGDDELHRAAQRGIHDGNHIVFRLLPATIAQIIEHKVWKSRPRKFKDFGEYALAQTSDGLGIANNQQLWLLRCAMDVHDAHIKQWAEVLARVEEMVRVQAINDGAKILSKRGLEELAKNVSDNIGPARITYLPSRQSEFDGHLIRLRENKPDVFYKVINGELSIVEARKRAGMKVGHHTNLGRAQSAFRRMTAGERRAFIDWLRSESYL